MAVDEPSASSGAVHGDQLTEAADVTIHGSPFNYKSSRQLHMDLWQLKNDGVLCDVKLYICGHVISAHRVVLANCSNYFREQFSSSSSESKKESIEIPGIDSPTFSSLVEFAYKGELNITDTNVQQLQHAASLLQMTEVQDACRACLDRQKSTLGSLLLDDSSEPVRNEDTSQLAPISSSAACSSKSNLRMMRQTCRQLYNDESLVKKNVEELALYRTGRDEFLLSVKDELSDTWMCMRKFGVCFTRWKVDDDISHKEMIRDARATPFVRNDTPLGEVEEIVHGFLSDSRVLRVTIDGFHFSDESMGQICDLLRNTSIRELKILAPFSTTSDARLYDVVHGCPNLKKLSIGFHRCTEKNVPIEKEFLIFAASRLESLIVHTRVLGQLHSIDASEVDDDLLYRLLCGEKCTQLELFYFLSLVTAEGIYSVIELLHAKSSPNATFKAYFRVELHDRFCRLLKIRDEIDHVRGSGSPTSIIRSSATGAKSMFTITTTLGDRTGYYKIHITKKPAPEPSPASKDRSSNGPLPSASAAIVKYRSIYAFESRSTNELSFQPGEQGGRMAVYESSTSSGRAHGDRVAFAADATPHGIPLNYKSSRLGTGLWQLRSDGVLCDVDLLNSGHVISAHRVVLAACSKYFRDMFSNLSESKKESRVIEGVDWPTFSSLVEFAYKGELNITDTNVQQLQHAASLLQMTEVQDACCAFLACQKAPSSCLGSLVVDDCSEVVRSEDKQELDKLQVEAQLGEDKGKEVVEVKEEIMETDEEEEKEEKPDPRIFLYKIFILTSACRTLNEVVFSKTEMTKQILERGGIVVEDINRVPLTADAYLISDAHYRTHKYLAAMARGMPCVSHRWLVECVKTERLVPYAAYKLPAGMSLLNGELYPLPDIRGKLLVDRTIMVHCRSDAQCKRGTMGFKQIWSPIVELLGGRVVSDACLANATPASTLSLVYPDHFDILLTDSSCEPAVVAKLEAAGKAVVSSEWIIQSIIMGACQDFSAHERFRVFEQALLQQQLKLMDDISTSRMTSSTGGSAKNLTTSSTIADDSCIFCCDAPRDAVFLNCEHQIACYECAMRIKNKDGICPYDRRLIARVFKPKKP